MLLLALMRALALTDACSCFVLMHLVSVRDVSSARTGLIGAHVFVVCGWVTGCGRGSGPDRHFVV